ncbi:MULTISPECIES: hypothetical protein [Streptomyces]|uniref:Secreted protein n=1 Tax=Streptomyces indiaensis TaxID=284033 RepID=A0ABP5RHG5_9ACTN|nr:hypothetical protein [Streptomyces indiaensis]MCF1644063.1 hypothetical protein [Streptomyces indiaensis]
MESAPAIFTGAVFSLFGGALLAWTVTRARRHLPVAQGARPVASATVASVVAVLALASAAWCFTRL